MLTREIFNKTSDTKILFYQNTLLAEEGTHLEFLKLFLVLARFSFGDFQYVETHCLTEWTALTNSYHITKADIPTKKEKKRALNKKPYQQQHCTSNIVKY